MTILIAQSRPAFGFLLFLMPMLVFAGIVVWLVVKAVKNDRDLTHQERLRAIEHGLQPASFENEKQYQHNIFWTAFWIGGGVPIAAVVCTANTVMQTDIPTTLKTFIWGGVVIVFVAGVVSAAFLMRSARPSKEKPMSNSTSRPSLPNEDAH